MSTTIPRRVLQCLLPALVFATAAPAQLSDWSAIPTSPSASVQLEQSLAIVRDGNTVNAYSALLKRWSSVSTIAGPPTITLLNEHAVVRDGPVFYGYSPRTGMFHAKLTFSPGATLLPSGSPQTWHSVLVDGNFVHVFLALTGEWQTYVFSAPPVTTMGRFCVLFADGPQIYAVSSFYGSLVPLLVPGAAVQGAYGNAGIALSAGFVHGFSASRNVWASAPVTGTPAVTTGNAQPGFVAVRDAGSVSFFSGNTGTFTTVAASAAATVTLQRYVGLVADGPVVTAYGSLLGSSSTITMATAPSVLMQQGFLMLDDGTGVTAYSPVTGAFSPTFPTTLPQVQATAQIAMASAGTPPVPIAMYSSYLNTWTSTPAMVSVTTYLNAVSAVLVDTAGGLYGLSMRGTQWIFEPTGPIDQAVAGTSPPGLAETFYARSGNTIYTFNPRVQAWRSTTTNSAATLVRAHHAAILAHDGATAYGFNIWGDRWSSQALNAPIVSASGQVQSAIVNTGSQVYAYGGFGQLSMVGEYPDFYRAASQGSLFRLDLVGEVGSSALIGLSPAGASIPIPGMGTLLLDPASLLIFTQPTIPGTGVFTFSLQVPIVAGISGLEIHFQAAIAGPSGVYLTNSVVPTIF